MYKNKKFLAIIPARSGSKGLIDKNIKPLNKKPLMAYTIEAALSSNVFDDVIVSTDCEVYASIAKRYNASVPSLRPKYLSTDTASIYDVIVYTLDFLKQKGHNYDYFVLLQPTSPLRKDSDIVNAIDLALDKSANAVVSVCPVEHASFLSINLNEDKKLDGFSNTHIRQNYPNEYRLNGAIYVCNVDYYLKYKNFYYKNCFAYIMDKTSSIDIDDIYDFKFAEAVLNQII